MSSSEPSGYFHRLILSAKIKIRPKEKITMADEKTTGFQEGRDRNDRTVEIGGERMAEKLRDHRETSPTLTGGDVDADWTDADDVGEEAVGGGNPTPDQSIVEVPN
jgi:hypothetical protein